MSGVASKLKQSLTCSHCSKIYKDPIELPCKHIICSYHLTEKIAVKLNKFKCSKCKQDFKIKDNEFKSISYYEQILVNQLYLSDDEISLKQTIEQLCKVLFKMHHEFTLSKTNLDLDCHNHFQEIRFQIDIHREKLKEKIDNIYMEMIEETKSLEEKYLKSFDEKLSGPIKSFFDLNPVEEEQLKEIEDTFRDPLLVIESIRELKVKQEQTIKTIQLKLNEMNQKNVDLKASNKFKPNLTFSKSLTQFIFGSLYLNRLDTQFKSEILAYNQYKDLVELCEFDSRDKFKLLYRASRDGFGSNDFHSKCDGKANTLTVFKATETEFIFGSFTAATWESNNDGVYKPDPNAFLFSLTNNDNQPCKMYIDPRQVHQAIYSRSGCGASMGAGHDIYIADNANTSNESYSNLGFTYSHPVYYEETNEAETFLAGSYHFKLSEIEVYRLE
jgi:hypothetical protein